MPADDTIQALVGKTLDGKYRIDRLIGAGGMGAVFRAEHGGTGRVVAVKTILPRLVNSPETLERFRREARAVGALSHPNIVNVTDFGVADVGHDEVAYLVMEYLEGRTLGSLLRESGKLPATVVVDVVEQVALALDAAHGAGIVHRDLKPENIWLVPDARGSFVIQVLDFGIAKLGESGEAADAHSIGASVLDDGADPQATAVMRTSEEGESGQQTVMQSATSDSASETVNSPALTAVGSTVGTPAYMSPEQCLGSNVSFRSDLYSLGAVAWQALVGRPMFEGSFLVLVDKHLHQTPTRVDEEVSHLPRSLGTAVAKSLEKDPEDRHPSARAMAGSFRVAIEGPGVILRRVAALYLEHLEPFLRISWRAARPALGLSLAFTLSLALGVTAGTRMLEPRMVEILWRIAFWGVTLGGAIFWGLVTVRTHAAFAAAIDKLRTTPLESLDVGDTFATVNRRIGVNEKASDVRSLFRLLAFYLKCEARAPAGRGDLAFQIAFHEECPPEQVKDRCTLLAAGVKKAYDRLGFLIFASVLALPALQGYLLFSVGALAGIPRGEAFGIAISVTMLLLPITATIVNPFLSPALALLYFRARQANGEDVALAAVAGSRL